MEKTETYDMRVVVGSGSSRCPSGSVDSTSNTLSRDAKERVRVSIARYLPGQILQDII